MVHPEPVSLVLNRLAEQQQTFSFVGVVLVLRRKQFRCLTGGSGSPWLRSSTAAALIQQARDTRRERTSRSESSSNRSSSKGGGGGEQLLEKWSTAVELLLHMSPPATYQRPTSTVSL